MLDNPVIPDYASVSHKIQLLSDELGAAVRALSPEVFRSGDHKCRRYRSAVVPFARAANNLEFQYSQQVASAAREITRCAGEGWDKIPEVVGLWRQLAEAVTNFSEHPTKKNAALIIGKDNMLEAFAANRVPGGVEKRGKHYVKGKRKDYIICAERMALANFLGLKLQPLPAKSVSNGIIRGAIAGFSSAITAAGRHSTELHESVVLATTTPCDLCIESLAAFRPRAVYANGDAGKGYTRDVGFDRAKETLAAQGIALLHLA